METSLANVLELLVNCKVLKIHQNYLGFEVTIDGSDYLIPDTDFSNVIFPNTLTELWYTSRFPDAVCYKYFNVPPSVCKLYLTVLNKETEGKLGNPTHLILDEMHEDDIKFIPKSVTKLDIGLAVFKNSQSKEEKLNNIDVTIDDVDYDDDD